MFGKMMSSTRRPAQAAAGSDTGPSEEVQQPSGAWAVPIGWAIAHALHTLPEFDAARRWQTDQRPLPFRVACLGYAKLPTVTTPDPAVLRLDDPAMLAAGVDGNAADFGMLTDPHRTQAYLAPLRAFAPHAVLWALLINVPIPGGHYRSSAWVLTQAGHVITGYHHTGPWLELAEMLAPILPESMTSALSPQDKAARARHAGPFRDGKASILSAREFQAALAAMRSADHPAAWKVVGDVAVYRKVSGSGGYVDVQRQGTGATPDALLAELARTGSDALSDTYASITARYISSGAPTEGLWINVNDVLRDRGVLELPSGGHRTEDRLSIGRHLAELTNWRLHSQLPSWEGKYAARSRPYVIESLLLSVTDTVYQTLAGGEQVPVAVRCTLGEYARYFLTNGAGRQTCLLMQAALRYDPTHERTQKRLAYHFAFRFRMAAYTQEYEQPITVDTLFHDACVETDGPTQRANPSRTIQRWVQALSNLQRDGIIASYELLPSKGEPLRSKLAQWLAQQIRIVPPESIKDHYAEIGGRRPSRSARSAATTLPAIPQQPSGEAAAPVDTSYGTG